MSVEPNLANLIPSSLVTIQPVSLMAAREQDVTVDLLRLDSIHPVISGNKYFKLKYHVEAAIDSGSKGILSFGGAYSNHLAALACYCHDAGLQSVGVIRGEHPMNPSPTISLAAGYGMKHVFVSRSEYKNSQILNEQMSREFPGFMIVPEGGRSGHGVKGASEILAAADTARYNIIACAVGTGTMMAGLLQGISESQMVMGFSSLKLKAGNDVELYVRSHADSKKYMISYDYHFGGYAKITPTLIDYMNQLWLGEKIQTDFVYTAKMMFGIQDYVKKNLFPPGSRILAVHSGGLQGNQSLQHRLLF